MTEQAEISSRQRLESDFDGMIEHLKQGIPYFVRQVEESFPENSFNDPDAKWNDEWRRAASTRMCSFFYGVRI